MHAFLDVLYHDHQHIDLAAGKDSISNDLINRVKQAFIKAAEWVHGKKGFTAKDLDDPAVKQLINENYQAFLSAVQPNLTEKVPEVMQQALKENVFVFSGMKTYTSLKEVGSLDFTDSDGKPKSWHEFKKDADKLNVKYNETYLRTEHQFAYNSSQQAANWAAYEADGDRYLLQYRTAEDDRVREEHQELAGTTLPKDDAFWNNYFPPNGWNCRCSIVQVRKGKYEVSDSQKAIEAGRRATTKIGKDGRNAAAIFRFNPGKDQKIFPKGHPYTSGNCSKLSAVWRFLSATQRVNLANERDKCQAGKKVAELAKLVEVKQLKKYDNGGVLETYHNLVDKESPDYKNVFDSANYFAKNGHTVRILPKVHVKNDPIYDMIYGRLKGTPFYGKSPDILIDGSFYEHEGFITNNAKSALKNMMTRGLKQSDKIIIEKSGVTNRYLQNNIRARIKEGQNITEVWEKDGKALTLIYKKTEAQ